MPASRSASPVGGRGPRAALPPSRRASVAEAADVAAAEGVALLSAPAECAGARSEAELEREGEHHARLADQADAEVRRTLYNPATSLLSDNKADWSLGIEVERKRADAASLEGRAIRESGVDRLTEPQAYSALVWKSRGLNCDELCHATEDCIARADPTVRLNRLQFKYVHPEYGPYGHAVTVIGELTPAMLKRPMTEWPANLVVCDPWGDIASCRAKDYAGRFLAGMLDWADRDIGVRIRPNRWEDASDPDWLEVVDHVQGALVRSKPDEGPLQYRVLKA